MIDGRLVTETGQPLAGQAVVMQTRPRVVGSPWKAVGVARTDREGRVSFTVAPSPSLHLRLVFQGTETLTGARSVQLETHVRARSSIEVNHRTRRNGQTARFSGRLLGGYVPKRGRDVELQRRDPLKKRWIRVRTGRVHTDAKGRWHASYRFTTSHSRTVFKFRLRIADRGDAPFTEGFSRTVRVAVVGRRRPPSFGVRASHLTLGPGAPYGGATA